MFPVNIKKHISLNLICLLLCSSISAQQKAEPPFNIKKTVLHIPTILPGIMIDPSAQLINDTLIYEVKGQFFDTGYSLKPGQRPVSLSTPWETIKEMTDAYSKKDAKRIIDLYATGSKEKIRELLAGSKAGQFLDYVSKGANSNLRLLGGIQYKSGFMAYMKDDLYGIHENFIIKEKNKYKLAALNDKSPTSWNIGIFLNVNPKPLYRITNVSLPDSLGSEDSVAVRITLQDRGYWVIVYTDNPKAPLIYFAQDNGEYDMDPAEKQVHFYLKGGDFYGPNAYTIYISALNYRVNKIAPNFITGEGKYTIKIY